ncbi:MAG: PAS domain S-box protein [Nitrospinae bacterium]|nr:PAS domain S-box protein [Nitrospinota bacterium]
MEKPNFFESVLSSFSDAVIIIGPGGAVEWLNAAAEQLTGLPISQAKGMAFNAVLAEGDAAHDAAAGVMRDGVSRTDHGAMLKNRKGSLFPVDVSAFPFGDESNRFTAVIVRDLTGLRALERLVAAQDKVVELSTLAAGIAHEIKNPLGGIRGAAQLIGSEAASEMKECADLIIREADRINRLVLSLINLNQPEDFPKNPVNIYPALDDALKILGPAISAKGIKVLRVYDPSLPLVAGDEDRLRQIFLNVAKNAVEACEAGGTVTITTSLAWSVPRLAPQGAGRRFIRVEVADDGAGLDEEAISMLFTPFFSKKHGGSGLGLSMTLHLVRAHGGSLDIQNRQEGKGAAASVYLPYIMP